MALGFYELFTGLGMIAGPLLGSALFTAGGYSLPFYFVAALLGGAAILNAILLKSSEPQTADYEIFHSPMPDDSINGYGPESEFHSSSRSQYSTDFHQGKDTFCHMISHMTRYVACRRTKIYFKTTDKWAFHDCLDTVAPSLGLYGFRNALYRSPSCRYRCD